MASQDLLGFIRDLTDHLALGRGVGDEVLVAIAGAKDHLESVYARYEEPAPEGAEVVREYMLEALQLYYRALEEIEAFLEDGSRPHLTEAALAAQEGEDILQSLEDILQQGSDRLSELH